MEALLTYLINILSATALLKKQQGQHFLPLGLMHKDKSILLLLGSILALSFVSEEIK